MRRNVLFILIWALCFVAAEEDDKKCKGPAQCRCVPPPGQSFSCNNNEICGCRLNVTYDETAKQWRKGGEPVQIKFTGPDPDACEMEKLGEFAFTCFDKDCTTQMSQPAAAAELCLKTVNRTCDGLFYERSILKKTELGCVLILDNNDGDGLLHGPLKRTVHSYWMSDGGNSSYCESSSKKLSESKIRYQLRYYCGTDDCETDFDVATQHKNCLRDDGTKRTFNYMQCGNDHRIGPKTQYCWFTWERQGDELLFSGTTFADQSTRHLNQEDCPVYNGEEIAILCTKQCVNISEARRDSDEFCAEMIKSNRATRQAINIVFPVLLCVVAAGIAYATFSTMRKARYAHSLVMQEFKTEFATVPPTSNSDDLQKKMKNNLKLVKPKFGGKRAKNGLEGKPF